MLAGSSVGASSGTSGGVPFVGYHPAFLPSGEHLGRELSRTMSGRAKDPLIGRPKVPVASRALCLSGSGGRQTSAYRSFPFSSPAVGRDERSLTNHLGPAECVKLAAVASRNCGQQAPVTS